MWRSFLLHAHEKGRHLQKIETHRKTMPHPPQHVLVVCLGNICRSPMGEGILRRHIQTQGLRIKVDSAGTNGYHDGESPDRRAQQEMRRHGIDISKQSSRKILQGDFEKFDLILVMDQSNIRDVLQLAGNRDDWQSKIHMFVDDENVPDPFMAGQMDSVRSMTCWTMLPRTGWLRKD